MQLVYGPIHSLRYGSTLGINLLGPQKACSFNCAYCHLGPNQLTMNKIRKEYEFPTPEQIAQAFRDYIAKSTIVDAIVVSGNGEPTLHPNFDEVMKQIYELRQEHLPDRKIIVLSNSAHLDQRKVIAGLNMADERVLKLDAGSEAQLQRLNDPVVRLNFTKLLNGIAQVKGVTIQSLFVGGELSNSSNEAVEEWIEVIGMIKPLSVQLCTVSRAPMNPVCLPVDEDLLYSIAFKLKKRTGIESHVFPAKKVGA